MVRRNREERAEDGHHAIFRSHFHLLLLLLVMVVCNHNTGNVFARKLLQARRRDHVGHDGAGEEVLEVGRDVVPRRVALPRE